MPIIWAPTCLQAQHYLRSRASTAFLPRVADPPLPILPALPRHAPCRDTALHCAALRDYDGPVQLLLTAGARPWATNAKSLTPVRIAWPPTCICQLAAATKKSPSIMMSSMP